MRNVDVRPIVEELLARVDAHQSWQTEPSSVAAGDYVDASHLSFELEHVFARTPQAVALSPDLPAPGSHVTRDLPGLPIVLMRDDNGVARGFANVCAHRGAQVVADGRGCSARMSCPYHGWTYDTSGTLVGVSDRGAFPDVTVPGPGLVELPTVEQDGVIWLAPGAAAPAPRPDLGPFANDFTTFDINGHEHWRTHRFELEFNWKLVIDTFLEGYHFASLHRTTVGPLFLANLCHAERHGPHVREVLPRRSLVELRDEPPETWDLIPHSAIVYVLFPNTVFVMQIDHLETWRVTPDPSVPGRSVCELDFYIPAGELTASAIRHWEKNWDLTINTVIHEDFAAMAGVQRGLATGMIDHLRIGANEPALGFFHAALDDAHAATRAAQVE